MCPGEGNRWVFRPGAGNHRVFHPGEGNRRVFHPRSRKSPGFPPRCTGFSTQEQGTTGFSAQVHRVFHPGAPGFPPRRTENLSGGRVGWGETEDALTRLKTPEGSADHSGHAPSSLHGRFIELFSRFFCLLVSIGKQQNR